MTSSPEELLQALEHNSETGPRQGHLKIFFGYAAGVGKTYAMLEAAHTAQNQGIDVVAGYIEPHTRTQTMELLTGLEQLPLKNIPHQNMLLHEFDLDGAIQRKPQLILVDELAHTNAPTSRHVKRYQDIQELLNMGIDVYTTVNVQHIESLNDIVASITGIVVRERIPDRIFDTAYQVELVDIEPEDLIRRLNEGKVYDPDHAQDALSNFFSINNLIALREIALRRTADRVNRLAEKVRPSLERHYYTEEHILVCLSPSPSNAKIIRTAARMYHAFRGTFTAIYVESPKSVRLSDEDRQRLNRNLKLAEQLGAKIEMIHGEDVAYQIAEFARMASVSKIVIGRSNQKKRLFFSKTLFSERLAELAPNLDIYIIPDNDVSYYNPQKRRLLTATSTNLFSLKELGKTILVLAGCTLAGYLFERAGFSEANIITVYILGVLIIAVWNFSKIYSLVSSVLAVLIFNFLFTVPKFSLKAYDPSYPVTFAIMFLSAFLTSTLAGKIKRQAKQSALTAYRTKVLLETNQMLQLAKDQKAIISATATQLIKLFGKTVVFYPVEEQLLGHPEIYPTENMLENPQELITPNEQAVAHWVFTNNKHAGATTNTLSNAKCMYLAVRSTSEVDAVVGIAFDKDTPDAFEIELLHSMLGECALALEKDLYARKKEAALAKAKNEQLRSNLLRSISHDLRTPLTSISGNASVLLRSGRQLDEAKKEELYTGIYDDSMWLINLVENLLSVTRIEEGTMNLQMEAEIIDEVIEEALHHISRKGEEHNIQAVPSDDFILAKMDVRLILQVIINLVDNAIKYTPPGSDIIISTSKKNHMAVITVADNGPGIPDENKEKVFDMFFTANRSVADSRRGMGLGLALCKSIVQAHGGTIQITDNKPHGTIFTFTLQAEEVTLHE